MEDACILSEEAEDQPRHEVVEVFASGLSAPVGIVTEQFDVEAVEASGRLDIEGVFPDLLNGGDSGEGQEKAKVIGKVGIGAGHGFAIDEVLRLEALAIGCEDELCLLPGRSGALSEFVEGCRYFAVRADLEVNVVPLKNPAG